MSISRLWCAVAYVLRSTLLQIILLSIIVIFGMCLLQLAVLGVRCEERWTRARVCILRYIARNKHIIIITIIIIIYLYIQLIHIYIYIISLYHIMYIYKYKYNINIYININNLSLRFHIRKQLHIQRNADAGCLVYALADRCLRGVETSQGTNTISATLKLGSARAD